MSKKSKKQLERDIERGIKSYRSGNTSKSVVIGILVTIALIVGGSVFTDTNLIDKIPGAQGTVFSELNQEALDIARGFKGTKGNSEVKQPTFKTDGTTITYVELPEFNGTNYNFEINGNVPTVVKDNYVFDEYSTNIPELDHLGRAQGSTAIVSAETREHSKRDGSPEDSIGYKHVEFNIDGKKQRVYDRSHLVAYSLVKNPARDTKENVVTGTRQFNYSSWGMNKFEDQVRDAIDKDSTAKILYQVTPVYNGDEVVPRGVQMQAKSLDGAVTVNYNVFVFNVKDGVNVDYMTGVNPTQK